MWRFLPFCCVAACGFTHGDLPPDARVPDASLDAPIDAALPLHLRVEAWMDGRSHLIFHDATLRWHHFEFAAPGREGGETKPTILDGVDWYPTWPDVPNPDNRDCDCDSSTHTSLPITLPHRASTTTLGVIQVRKQPSVVQQASADNDYTLIVELLDTGPGAAGATTNIVELVIAFD